MGFVVACFCVWDFYVCFLCDVLCRILCWIFLWDFVSLLFGIFVVLLLGMLCVGFDCILCFLV